VRTRSLRVANKTDCMTLDWDGSDGEYGSSEPMDSIAELCGPMDNELETQL
jgi:hypothetical protein